MRFRRFRVCFRKFLGLCWMEEVQERGWVGGGGRRAGEGGCTLRQAPNSTAISQGTELSLVPCNSSMRGRCRLQ